MKVLITSITDSGILRVRKELLKALLLEGHNVVVVTPATTAFSQIVQLGCKFIPICINGQGVNPLKDFGVVLAYRKILRKEKPDIVLSFTIKPNLYCGINCRMMSIPQVMNITGFGIALAYPGIRQKLLVSLYKIVAKKVKLIFFQNESNLNQFKKWNIASKNHYKLLPGSGVNLSDFAVTPYPSDENGIHFLFVSRILKEKGIDNYIEAARVIKRKYPNTYFHVLGNATKAYTDIIEQANKDDLIEYHGRVNNVSDYQKMSHCTVLPSYYPEGICNVLLEGAASGRPVITCDHPGCREAVNDGVTGYLVKPNDTKDLIEKIERFLKLSNTDRMKMGRAGRKKMECEFDRKIVVDAYLDAIRKSEI